MKVFTTARNGFWGLLAVLGLVTLWQISAARINLPLILPGPRAAFHQIGLLLTEPIFWHSIQGSLLRGLVGFSLSLVVGLGIGCLSGFYEPVGAFFRPLIVLVRSAPSMSLILLALIWFKKDTVAVFVIFLVVFPIITQNVIEGIRNIDRELTEMLSVFQIALWKRVTMFYLPSLWPYLIAGITAGLGLTWKVLIAAEVLAYPRWGIGTQMDSARVYLETDKVFAWTILVIGVGLIFDCLLGVLSTKVRSGLREGRDV